MNMTNVNDELGRLNNGIMELHGDSVLVRGQVTVSFKVEHTQYKIHLQMVFAITTK